MVLHNGCVLESMGVVGRVMGVAAVTPSLASKQHLTCSTLWLVCNLMKTILLLQQRH